MATHHGGKVGKAGKTLASKSSSKSGKSKAGSTLATHKARCHQLVAVAPGVKRGFSFAPTMPIRFSKFGGRR